jgi:hypothetical protein
MKLYLTLLLVALSCTASFASDPNAGMVAAREMGLANYVEFKNNGKADSAALFFWRGNWWVYHPSFGSMKTVMEDPDSVPLMVTLVIDGAVGPLQWKPITDMSLKAELTNGCLPRAVAEVRKHGGGILITQNHAKAIR